MLLKGKYANSTFQEVLETDTAYCEFIVSCKYLKPDFQIFKDWLTCDDKLVNYVRNAKLHAFMKTNK